MSDAADQITTVMHSIEQYAVKYGPPAVEEAARIVHYRAVWALMEVVAFFALASACVLIGVFSFCRGLYRAKQNDDCEGWVVLGVISIIVGLVIFIPVTLSLCDADLWMAIYEPKMALAAKVLDHLTR
jgi:hypothetical protein